MATPEQLEQAIAALEAQRAMLGDAVVEAALAPLRQKLAELEEEESPPALTLEGERRLVTILFADISGFTALAETMDPETVRDLMNDCFAHLVPAIQQYGGTVDKFIGDAVMALFGAPVAHENDAERALRAALEMMQALAAFNAARALDLGLHIGVNTGLVIAGGIGALDRQQYSVIGDAVNVANRLEEVSQRGEILVGADTCRLTSALFDFEGQDPIEVKGKAEPVPIYRLLRPKATPGRVRGIAGQGSPLVGRASELRALQTAVERLAAGQGGIVTLLGEAGLGKSRLVAEVCSASNAASVLERAPRSSGLPRWIEGRCLSYGTAIAYLLWVDILRSLLGVTLDAHAEEVRAALHEQVCAACEDLAAEVYPFLARLLALPLDDKHAAIVSQLDGEQLKQGTFHAVRTLLAAAARQQPLAVVCEDLHWADPTSLDLLEHLLDLTAAAPLLLICVTRPERETRSWRLRETTMAHHASRHTDLWLAPLSPAESAALVSNLLRVEALPRELRDRILRHAEGNPFFVEEIIRTLMADGAIVRDAASGRWRATRDVAEIAIPDTLQGVLMARIDRLQEEVRRVLQLAAVIGRIFFYRVLEAIAHEERTLDDHLLTLQREDLIRERARLPELEYIFKHHLTQEAAYNGLLKRDRRAFHRQVAEALERLFPDRVEEQLGLLAYHWERAEEPEKATAYLLRAGDQARVAYTHEEAAGFYRRALHFLQEENKLQQAARTLMKLGLTYHAGLDFARSRAAYEEAFALWQRAAQEEGASTRPPAPHPLRVPWNDPRTLDPTQSVYLATADIARQLFCGLVDLSPELDVVPDVARRWEVQEEGRRYIFHLRDDCRWSDGTPVTAGDFEYAWKRQLHPAFGPGLPVLLFDVRGARAYRFGEAAGPDDVGVHALDDHTLVVELEEPAAYFLNLLAAPNTYAIPRHVVEAHGADWAQPAHLVTSGPFRVDAWQPGEALALVRNPAYHGQARGNVPRVEVDLRPAGTADLEARYAADELDVISLLTFTPEEHDRARQRAAEHYISAPVLRTFFVGFDVTRPPFSDPRVRQALVHAVDRETLVPTVMRGQAFPATGGFVPPGMVGHSAGIGLPYDVALARRLLAEAGYPAGQGFPVVEGISAFAYPWAEPLAAAWREVLGIEVQWRVLNVPEFEAQVAAAEPPSLFISGWIADYPDPYNFLRACTARRIGRWQDATYDELVSTARRTADQEVRMRLYMQADRIQVEQAAMMPMTYGRQHYLVKPWVRQYPTSAICAAFWKDVVIEAHAHPGHQGG